MNVISNIMSRIRRMFQFLLGKRQPPPPVYYSRSTYASTSSAYTAPVGAKILKG
jgi:hypothetical protein